MLKNSKIGCNWIFQIITGYYNWIYLISVVLSLVFFVVYVVVALKLETTEGRFFFREFIWTVYMGYSRTRTRHS